MPTLTAEAKQLLSSTIRALRERLLRDIRDEAERRYHLSLPMNKAGLNEAHRRKRERLEAWLDERVRATAPKKGGPLKPSQEKAARERLLHDAVKEAGATLINRVVLLRLLEAAGLAKPEVVAGGWNSKGYGEFRDFAPGLLADATEGYGTLLQVVFDELALDLPGLFGDVGLTELFPIPPATLREVISKLDQKELESAWTDDTTLGWVYQYWNDPEREALDAKINDGGKIEPHEIASKTQMFTERYMVEWLLQNSLGLTWLCICKKNGWIPEAEKVLPGLETRREQWRARREAGEVALDALMPIENELEDAWKYYVLQPIPEDAVENAPASVAELKLLDPACGSGHFLVIAFDLLTRMYREEARHRGQSLTDDEIAGSVLANNLHGVDIDPRAVQIAAAALYIKAKTSAPKAEVPPLNLVAPAFHLGELDEDDASLIQLRKDLKREVGLPEELTSKLVAALAGVDHLGTLLKVDSAVDEALKATELEITRGRPGQGDMFQGFPMQQVKLTLGEARATVLDRLEQFLSRHSSAEDLGLRLDGTQLASGVRFVRIVKEGRYDVVVGNPPYQGTSRMANPEYVAKNYSSAKADLYAAFLVRACELACEGGVAALVTMRGWMFLGQFTELRQSVAELYRLRAIGDLGTGAFGSRSMDDVISTSLVVLQRLAPHGAASAVQAAPLVDLQRDAGKPARRRASLLAQHALHRFQPKAFDVIEGRPIVYWWREEFLERYGEAPKLAERFPAKKGLCTGDDGRFTRLWFECAGDVGTFLSRRGAWVPTIKGGKGRQWFEPLVDLVRYDQNGLELREKGAQARTGTRFQNEKYYFRLGVAFAMIGSSFSARIHRFGSVFGNMGSSVFPEVDELFDALCFMNSTTAKAVLQALNPGVHFEVGDVNRLPVFPVQNSKEIGKCLEHAFAEHESRREQSVEFRQPGPSTWLYAQNWAQGAVDRPEGEALPPYEPEYAPPEPEAALSFALGVALGRFDPNGSGIVSGAHGLPGGMLFLSADTDEAWDESNEFHATIVKAWSENPLSPGTLNTYLRTKFFAYHNKLYEKRPIYFPLSSAKKSFVAYVSIHRWQDDTLNVLLADHLVPEKRRLEGELDDLRKARAEAGDKGAAEKRFAEVQKLLEELNEFIETVTQLAECGPAPSDSKTPAREVDARFVMDLDDGVMVNSAALWPLLEPQWKAPKKWWKELATASGRKDYDWAHLAARYFPSRVRAKCVDDPSLAVAHKCFWALHPAKAFAWELRLQDELNPDFTIDEPGSDAAREAFLTDHAREAEELRGAELKRRQRKAAKLEGPGDGPLFDVPGPHDSAPDSASTPSQAPSKTPAKQTTKRRTRGDEHA